MRRKVRGIGFYLKHKADACLTASRLLVIDEVIGFFAYSATCNATVQTAIVPRVLLHPDLRQFAIELFERHMPLA